MDNYSPLNSLMNDHMLDLQEQFGRAHFNTKTEDCNRIAKNIALVSIAQSLINISEILDRYTPNDILDSNDREEDMSS
ncbi:MAG: hypothetical protein CBD62_01090 [Candidatus Pelagibacter sp. TMED202]|nr:MAG: hypothetical protein CBD62_01090 [Candidatus Pelagibacter sp. TMED202]|tara:strand:+ start:117 stop:350 length:234 start_codon:yes stop_codon:yes gene_type:complete